MQETSKRTRELYRSVFRKVMAMYKEFKQTNGTESCSGFYKKLAEGVSGSPWNPKVISVSTVDFVCDIDNLAQRTLTEGDYMFFKLIFVENNKEFEDELRNGYGNVTFMKRKHGIQEIIGSKFMSERFYPIKKYFSVRDLR